MLKTQTVVGILRRAGHHAAVRGIRDGFKVVGSQLLDRVNLTFVGGTEHQRPAACETYRKLFVDAGYVVEEDGDWLYIEPPTMPKLGH